MLRKCPVIKLITVPHWDSLFAIEPFNHIWHIGVYNYKCWHEQRQWAIVVRQCRASEISSFLPKTFTADEDDKCSNKESRLVHQNSRFCYGVMSSWNTSTAHTIAHSLPANFCWCRTHSNSGTSKRAGASECPASQHMSLGCNPVERSQNRSMQTVL